MLRMFYQHRRNRPSVPRVRKEGLSFEKISRFLRLTQRRFLYSDRATQFYSQNNGCSNLELFPRLQRVVQGLVDLIPLEITPVVQPIISGHIHSNRHRLQQTTRNSGKDRLLRSQLGKMLALICTQINV